MAASNKNFREFIRESKVDDIVLEIETRIKEKNNGQRPFYSDLIKMENGKEYEYINYVQEGGGVLGIALIGYTYVLEKMGFKFLRLAGTSAGSITTMMLAAVDKNNYPEKDYEYQSEIMLDELLNYDLWQLVDGHWLAKKLIRIFINYKFGTRLLKALLIASVCIPITYALYFLVLQLLNIQPGPGVVFRVFHGSFSALALISITALVIETGLFLYFRSRFARAGFGINTGKNFHDWITSILAKNNIHDLASLETVMYDRYKNIALRPERLAQNIPGDDLIIPYPFLTLVASDITAQTKVEFPLMARDYWLHPSDINPADFVRASMSIPIFFEPFKVTVPVSVQNSSRLQKMKSSLKEKIDSEPKVTSFVDGGILSNFPINVFHNPAVRVARMPTFGVKLEDKEHLPGGREQLNKKSLIRFIMDVFSTVRFYYDRDFLKRNEVYEQCIGYIDAAGYNWLNFGLDEKAKRELFYRGAEAAKSFFLGGKVWVDGKLKEVKPFDWQSFKHDRETMDK
jgi:NTE family protein